MTTDPITGVDQPPRTAGRCGDCGGCLTGTPCLYAQRLCACDGELWRRVDDDQPGICAVCGGVLPTPAAPAPEAGREAKALACVQNARALLAESGDTTAAGDWLAVAEEALAPARPAPAPDDAAAHAAGVDAPYITDERDLLARLEYAAHHYAPLGYDRYAALLFNSAAQALAAARAREGAELERRRFMQVWGRFIGWGIVSPEDGRGVVRVYGHEESPHYESLLATAFVENDDVDAAECAAIDAAMQRVAEMGRPARDDSTEVPRG